MTQKFRPYFTAAELTEIIRCVRLSSANISLLRNLESFSLKISKEIIQPQYTPAPSLLSKLGETNTAPAIPIQSLLDTFAYDPSSLSPSQLIRVQTYRWDKNLMSEAERIAFEEQIFSNPSPPSL